ncbi:hypothetical protein LTR95_010716 [Oleoguttula sp. CCFEE 5521]
MATPKVIIVTGANRGIGLAICKRILTTQPSISPLKLFAASRAGVDLGLQFNHATRSVIYPKLDISDKKSVRDFAEEVSQYGSVDVLINNAGVNLDNEYNYENAKKTIDVNYNATVDMCQIFIPLLSTHGRIVNLSSVASSLPPYPEPTRAKFRDPTNNLETLSDMADAFLASVKSSSEQSAGFGPPNRSYSVSKSLLNAATAVLARQTPGLVINACCPGWVATDMGVLVGAKPPKTPEQGASVPLNLAFGELGGVTGRYWANSSIRGKGEGEVQEW